VGRAEDTARANRHAARALPPSLGIAMKLRDWSPTIVLTVVAVVSLGAFLWVRYGSFGACVSGETSESFQKTIAALDGIAFHVIGRIWRRTSDWPQRGPDPYGARSHLPARFHVNVYAVCALCGLVAVRNRNKLAKQMSQFG